MSEIFPAEELSWMRRAAAPYLESPVAIFWGGSRGGKVGAAPLKSSDNDILMIGEKISQPVSLTLHSPVTGHKADIIIRDYDTFAYDCQAARTGGNASLLNICAFSHILHDQGGQAQSLQQNVIVHYNAGPYPIRRESLQRELADSRRDLDEVAAMHGVEQQAGILSLTHRFGWLTMRANRQWVARGKVLARYLGDKLPGHKEKLDAAFNVQALSRFLLGIPDVHQDGADAIDLHRQGNFPRGAIGRADTYHFARFSSRAMGLYLRSPHAPVRGAAEDWAHYMHTLTGGAVDAERATRPNNEYRYALARHVNQLMDLACFASLKTPDDCRLHERISLLGRQAPDVLAALPAALSGQPERLHEAGDSLLGKVVGEIRPLQARLSPNNLRVDVRKLGLI